MLIAAMSVAVAAATFSTQAAAGDPVAGALIGGGIGAAVGGPPGAAVGAVIGSIIGAESHYHHGSYDRRYYGAGYAAPAYYPPAPAYYGPPPAYYPPAPAYYAPGPVYYGPAGAIVYRSGPKYAYNTRYVRAYDYRIGYDGRRYPDDRRWR